MKSKNKNLQSNKKSTNNTQKKIKNKKQPPQSMREEDKIRYGIVGLGHIAQSAVLPAFKNVSENSVLKAFISGSQEKVDKLGKNFGITRTYNYDQFEECIENEELDAVYIALPNNMHLEFVTRAAKAGVHVLCEKPLGVTPDECYRMDQVARRNYVYIMTAYRLHFEKANMEVVELLNNDEIGEIKLFNSVFSFQIEDQNVRLDSSMGGGVLLDLAVYPINAARYIFQEHPVSVFSYNLMEEDRRFDQVEGSASTLLVFPDNKIAQFTSSFAMADSCYYEVIGSKGKIRLENAYAHTSDSELTIEVEGKKTKKKYKVQDQFAAEIKYFSDCILQQREPEPSAIEALIDLEIIEAIKESDRRGKMLNLDFLSKIKLKTPNKSQVIDKPRRQENPPLINVRSPRMERSR